MFQTLKNAWKITELKNKLIFTLVIIILYRIGANIPVPYVSSAVLSGFDATYGNTILGYMSLLSGGSLSQATLFALSVSPYITASIVVQLLTIAIPALERWSKDGEEGKKKINTLTRIVTVALALITSYGYTMLLSSNGWLVEGAGWFEYLVIIACYCAGAALIMWLAERINDNGIGNGISMILFANIIARGPYLASTVWDMVTSSEYHLAVGITLGVLSVALTVAIIIGIIWITDSERRIPIQYAKRVVGRKMYGGQGTNLPLKLNMSGVMPIIFASSIVSVPATIAAFIPKAEGYNNFINKFFNYNTWPYLIVYLVLILAFAYFYVMISFNPVEVANNIKNNGGAVPGIRTGKPTSDYIKKILNRITFIGALFLIVISGVPMILAIVAPTFKGIAFGGSSLLIVVGVALETVRDLEAQMAIRNYKGYLD